MRGVRAFDVDLREIACLQQSLPHCLQRLLSASWFLNKTIGAQANEILSEPTAV